MRSMARASPTASSRRASGLCNAPGCPRARFGQTTHARVPVAATWRRSPVAPRDGPKAAGSVSVRVLDRLKHRNRARRHDRGDRVLIDQLGVSVATQQDAEIIEPGNETLQFDSIDEKNRDRRLGLPYVIEKGVLEVLRLLGCHRSFRSLGLSGRLRSLRERLS